MGIVPRFTSNQVSADLIAAINANIPKSIRALKYIGEEFINKARDSGMYEDDTGNLRASIGYAIFRKGNVVGYKTAETSPESATFINDLASEIQTGDVQLILFAGMEYAMFVEENGYDVISGSVPTRDQILRDLTDLLV